MQHNNINHLHHLQPLLLQAQVLATSLPDMGLNPLLSFNELLSVAAFLKRKAAEREE